MAHCICDWPRECPGCGACEACDEECLCEPPGLGSDDDGDEPDGDCMDCGVCRGCAARAEAYFGDEAPIEEMHREVG